MSRELSSALTAYGPPSILEPLVPSFRTTPRYIYANTYTTARPKTTATTTTTTTITTSITTNPQATAKAATATATATTTTTTAAAAAATTLANLLQNSLQPTLSSNTANSSTASSDGIGEHWNSWTIIVDLANVTLVQAANNVSDGMHDGGSRYSLSSMIIMGIVAGILSLLTVVGNVMVMISFKIDKQLQTISNYFLFSLAIADFAIGLISMPLFAVTTIVGYWPLGPHICDTWLALDYLASNASVLNLLIISFDRYFSVTRPLTYRAKRTTNRAAIMISAAWGISLILWPPWIYSWPYIEGKRTVPQDECYIQFIETNQYITFLTALAAFYFPVTIMCFLYYRIWKETKKRQKDLPNLQAAGRKDASKRSNSSEENIAINYSGLLSISPMDYGVVNGMESWHGPCAESAADIDSIYMANMLNDTNYHDLPSRNSSIKIVRNVKESYRKNCLSSIRDWCIAWWHSGREDCDNIRYELDDQFDIKCNSTTTSTTNTNMPAELYALDGGGISDDGRMPASNSNILLPDISVTPLRSTLFNHGRHPNAGHLTSLASSYSAHNTIHQTINNNNNNNNNNSNEIETPLAVSQESVYTILIRLPCDDIKAGNSMETTTPSIKMIHDDIIPAIPTVNSSCRLTNLKSTVNRNSDYNNYLAMNRNLTHMGGSNIRLLPLNTKIIPKPLIKASTASTAAQTINSMNNTAGSSSVVTGVGSRYTIKKKRKTQEKRQESKAAKTLSAILLSFIITWTPYNILVLIKPLTTCSDCIPNELWEFFYALCYINSTINPMCYALCNASFRRTYIRILTCKWHSRNREAMVRGVYN